MKMVPHSVTALFVVLIGVLAAISGVAGFVGTVLGPIPPEDSIELHADLSIGTEPGAVSGSGSKQQQ